MPQQAKLGVFYFRGLSGVKRTSCVAVTMSAYDPKKRTRPRA